MVSWVSVWQGAATVESAGRNQSVVLLGNVNLIEASRGHGLFLIINIFLGEHISALFGDSFLHQRVGSYLWHVPSVLGDDHVLAIN